MIPARLPVVRRSRDLFIEIQQALTAMVAS
jgi:hypothetical protein